MRADPRPGGELTWTHHNGDTVAGAYVELVPDRRVVFTYGWQRTDVGVPPGSTVVAIDLRPSRGGTELHLVHRGLSGPMADAHDGGWANYLTRLATVAAGQTPDRTRSLTSASRRPIRRHSSGRAPHRCSNEPASPARP